MDVHVRVDLDDDGPVVVKSASGAGVERVHHERDRLERAVHPGVVALAGSGDDGDELRTRYAGEPVTRWTSTLGGVAGMGAAVASTLADLHDLGIVHGRLDSSHILIGDDGRPRLCGLAHPGDASPADDVSALAAVIGQLADRAPAPRRGPWGWLGHAGADRRALHQVVERATDPVPSRRPTARVLADAILAAVPTAGLPPGGPPPATGPDALDRIWAHAEHPSDDERWAAALGDGPLDLPLGPFPDGTEASPGGDGPGSDGSADADAGRLDDPWLPLAAVDTPGWADGDLTRDLPAAATRRAPRTADAPPTTGPSPRRRRLVALGAGGALATALAVAAATLAGSGGGAGTSRSGPPPAGGSCPPAAPPAADVDGDGCREALAVEGGTVDAGVARWSLGEPGDLVTLGDWDCDGHASAALLRPATGDVFVFSAWAEVDEPVTVRSSHRVDGAVALRAEPGPQGCDHLLVDRTTGAATTVEVPG